MEHYKEKIHPEANRRLQLDKWTKFKIGSGDILESVISAIEINDSFRNNLVEWQAKRGPDSVSHKKLITARKIKSNRFKIEQALYNHFYSEVSDEESFTEIMELVGKRYDLLSYLFFIKDWTKYAPLRPRIFTSVFKTLKVPLNMVMQCSWENYNEFLNRITEVQKHLQQREIKNGVRFIDAQSFCWILEYLEVGDGIHISPTSHQLITVKHRNVSRRELEKSAKPFSLEDLEGILKSQKDIGLKAERIVLQYEIENLKNENRPDLAEKVIQLSDEDTTLGYDIHSYYTNGKNKYIEVKAISAQDSNMRFFLSSNELAKSQKTEGYVFSLVSKINSENPVISEFLGGNLPLESLTPVNYEVNISTEEVRD